ncbi:MAG: protein kinase [Acidobacteria bacterium]|nr:protein kinase [Acidobacteriota bacterium]
MIGEILGHYRIVEKIGAGGMGEVYRATDTKLGRAVALKVLPAAAVDDKAAQARLLQEARIASALNHPHICTIFEVGEAVGLGYIAMEFVEGQPLSEAIPRDGLPAEMVVRYGAQIADALGHAHQRGVIHRDLKCANVIVTPQNRVKILDFGLATHRREEFTEATQSRVSLKESGAIAGTLYYIAPEILQGASADARSDIWALGVILYEMAASVRPFDGPTGFTLSSMILRDPPAPLRQSIPAGLRSVIDRCLTKEPAERYQRAGEVFAALQAIQSQVVVGSSAVTRRRSERNIRSLAVLPFANATADLEAEYLSDGITESLINSLAQLPRLHVMARSTVFRYKGQTTDPRTIGRELNVGAVLLGRILQRGDALLVTAELVDVADGWRLWGEQYNRKRADIFAVQDEIAREISEKLRVRLTGEDKKRLTKRHTQDTEAYHLYLKGRYYWNKRTREGLERGVEYFKQAIEKDPNYALAYAGLADSYYLLAGTAYGVLSPQEAIPQAKAAALKALQIDDKLAEAHASMASVLISEWNWPAAKKEFKRSMELNPGYATVRQWYAFYLTAMGRLEEALAEARRAHELDPLSIIINRDLGLVFYYARQPDRAIEQYRKTIELDPNFALAHQGLGRACLEKGMYQQAVEHMQRAASLAQESVAMSAALAHAYAVAGKREEAEKILGELLERSMRSYVEPMSIAVIYSGLGDKENAFGWLEKAHAEHSVGLHTLKVHPVFDGLHSDPRFADLLRRVGLPP